MGVSKVTKRAALFLGLAAAGAAAVAVIAIAGPLASIAAEPGSKEDPLATVGYVERFAQYNRVALPAGQSLRVGQGTEFVIVDAEAMSLPTNEFEPLHDELLDLSAGAPVLIEELQAYHHYVNSSSHDIFLRFETETTLMIRGSWK